MISQVDKFYILYTHTYTQLVNMNVSKEEKRKEWGNIAGNSSFSFLWMPEMVLCIFVPLDYKFHKIETFFCFIPHSILSIYAVVLDIFYIYNRHIG